MLTLGTWFLLGAFLIQIRGQPQGDPRMSSLADGREVTLTAHVIREGYARAAGAQQIRESIDVETEEIASQGESWPVQAGVRLSIYERTEPVERRAPSPGLDAAEGARWTGESPVAPLAFTYGTRLRILAKLHPARNYRNPGAFDYEGYLRDNGISVLGSAEAKDIERLPGFSGSRIQLWRTRVHASIVAKIHQLWPHVAGLAHGRHGSRRRIVPAQRDAHRVPALGHVSCAGCFGNEPEHSGVRHFLDAAPVSGRPRRGGHRYGCGLVRVCVCGGSWSTGMARRADAGNLPGRAPAVSRTQYDERHWRGGSGSSDRRSPCPVWRQFSADFSRGFHHRGHRRADSGADNLPYARGLRLLRVASYDLHVAPEVAQFRLDLRMIAGRLRRFVGERLGLALPALFMRVAIGLSGLIFISALMQAGLALLMAYHFHRATTMGMPANLAVIPLTQVLMPTAAAAVGLGYISTALAKPAVWISGLALEGIAGTVHWLGGAQVGGHSIADFV